MFDPNKITQVELAFIGAYVSAMRREYALLYSVLDLMDPRNLAVKDVVSAAKLARELQTMQSSFDESLHAIGKKHGSKLKSMTTAPSADELANLFTLSFFKLVSATANGKKDDGWFSGEPGAMKKFFAALQNIEKQKLPQLLSPYLAAAFKLFANNPKKYPLNDKPLDPWNINLPPQTFTFKNHLLYENDQEEYEEDDEDEDGDDDYYYQFGEDDDN
jgi:23S rRNA maturation mini-RNase III